MFRKFKDFLFPKVDKEVQATVDKKSLGNIWRICIMIFAFEAIALILFLLTRKEFDQDAKVSIASASFCLAACLIGASGAGYLRKVKDLPHFTVEAFNGIYYLFLSFWGVQIAYRNYTRNEQVLTFFAVQIMMVCFVPLKPIHGIFFSAAVYIIMYISMCSKDGGAGLNIFNYALLMIVTFIGMIVRYHSEISSAQKSVDLKKTVDMLEYNNRHDGLTGLRNRKALEEDVEKIIKSHVTAYMIDINYFKEINDTYGHAVGDAVLQETSKWLKSVFSEDRCYRYGGDEFLILSADGESYKEDTCTFFVPEVPDDKILLSVGHADGDPKNHDELFKLISEADGKLYEIKKKTHSPEYGGHGERK